MSAAGQAVVLLGLVLLALAAGGLGRWRRYRRSRLVRGAGEAEVDRLSWLFGPVWTLLYLTMGVARVAGIARGGRSPRRRRCR